MANHKSAEKRARQNLKRQKINHRLIAEVRTIEKKLQKALTDKDKKTADSLFHRLTSKMGKAAQKKCFHSNKASRKISRLATAVHKLS